MCSAVTVMVSLFASFTFSFSVIKTSLLQATSVSSSAALTPQVLRAPACFTNWILLAVVEVVVAVVEVAVVVVGEVVVVVVVVVVGEVMVVMVVGVVICVCVS